MKKTVLVTGASAGIGKATAIYLAENGYRVYGAARRLKKMDDLKKVGAKPIALDVTNEGDMSSCVQQILDETGRIDILINGAGFGSYGAIEDVLMEDARHQLEVNVMGAMRLAQLVLPGMRKNGSGKIINISSLGGKIALPMGAWYHASKFALEALSDCLRYEVNQFGINVIVVEPGATKSEWGNIAFNSLTKVSGNTPYKDLAVRTLESFSRMSKNIPEPVAIAQLIKKAIESKHPKTRYVGGGLNSKILLYLKRVLSDRMMDRLIMNQIK